MTMGKSNDGGGTEIDRLSALPDSLLCHILSFLPTRTTIAIMSLVSRRWRHLWKHLHVFDFDDSDPNFCNKKFAVFVNSVLALRKSRDIRKLYLILDNKFAGYNDYVNMWLHDAAGPCSGDFRTPSYWLALVLKNYDSPPNFNLSKGRGKDRINP
ncbi:hypothetical protein TSUD_190560 [Trifolium subterraneum]|uniref:F-box domain-containing protein n=1 Tax=Trifolium subterraneum TaxID=3900 RepID=A0A2Z6NBU5_TRISU|nr:hypothetical protein TSUD_190560 [Trifolium subterraneum]